MITLNEKDILRFESKFTKGTPEECWNWTDSLRRGYGKMKVGYTNYRAHRIAYSVYKGEIPEGMYVCHSCDNPSCVNPNHLWLGTHDDNMKDKAKKGRCPGWGGEVLRGSKNPRAKLKEEDIPVIKEMHHKEGISQSAIARLYGVASPTISSIILGNKWRHV